MHQDLARGSWRYRIGESQPSGGRIRRGQNTRDCRAAGVEADQHVLIIGRPGTTFVVWVVQHKVRGHDAGAQSCGKAKLGFGARLPGGDQWHGNWEHAWSEPLVSFSCVVWWVCAGSRCAMHFSTHRGPAPWGHHALTRGPRL